MTVISIINFCTFLVLLFIYAFMFRLVPVNQKIYKTKQNNKYKKIDLFDNGSH